jgi:hypothetical protein
MQRTDKTFTDGFAIDLFSAQPRTLSVTQNPNPSAPGEFVTAKDPSDMSLGSGFWTAVNNISWVMKFSDSGVNGMFLKISWFFHCSGAAIDLVAKLEAPYDPATLSASGLSDDNTFLAKFDATRTGWVVDTSRSNVHRYGVNYPWKPLSSLSVLSCRVENRTRIINLSSLDGEFMLVGRRIAGPDSQNTFIQCVLCPLFNSSFELPLKRYKRVGSEVKEADFNVTAPPAGSVGETGTPKITNIRECPLK